MFSLWIGAYDQGLAYAGLALGTYLTLRVLNFPDLTVDGSFALGGGTAAVLISQGAPVPAFVRAVLGRQGWSWSDRLALLSAAPARTHSACSASS
jgi:ABC-type uncharacterized transport system permease subunit